MIRLLSTLLILTFSLLHFAEAQEYPPRAVEMELEEVEDATAYELEFKSKKSGKKAKFKTETNQWKAKIRPGQYEVRLRSYDEREVPGPWSDYFPMTIAFPGPKMLKPVAGQKVDSGEEKEEEVDFEWEEINGVSLYRIEVTAGDKKWSEVTDDTDYSFTLPVATEYSWNVYAMQFKDDEGAGSSEPQKFVLLGEKLEEPEIIPPIDKYINQIGWTAPDRAESYTYMLSRKVKNGRWKRISRGKGLKKRMIDVPEDIPGGKFRLQVRAEAPNVVPSDIEKLEFDIFLGSRDPASVNENRLKESIEKPSNMYFIASYLVSNISYEGTDNERQERVEFGNAFAGTGRLGLGYLKPKATWGGFGFIDYGGFNHDGETQTFLATELHTTWRRYFGPNQLRVSGGLFMKEIQEGRPITPNSGNYEFQKVTYYGPHVGFDYWMPLTPKLGWQANARAYLGVAGSSENGNSDIVMTPSFQAGLMGSYKLSKDIMGFAGLAIRRDAINYKSETCTSGCSVGAQPDDEQEISYQGLYLNFLLEWGF